MGRGAIHRRDNQQRTLLAQAAARLMAESGLRDYALAKRKAAAQLGIHDRRLSPSNEEVELALREHLQLFQHHSQTEQLQQLRHTALQAMKLLAPFNPQLVGPVLQGTADRHSPIYLHLFADTSEEVTIFLLEHRIPFEQAERHVVYAPGREEHLPLLRFIAGEIALELTIFPVIATRQSPLSPIDGKPMQRASRQQLEQLLQVEEHS